MKKYDRGITFGVFDIFHVGHYNLLKRAKVRCKYLIVCVDSDEYVRVKKRHEPVLPLKFRQMIIKAIKFVDEVGRPQPVSMDKRWHIGHYKPDVIFAGEEWRDRYNNGISLGVPVVFLPRTKSISTTEMRRLDGNQRNIRRRI